MRRGSRRGHEVTLLKFDQPDTAAAYPLHPSTRRRDLGIGRTNRPAACANTDRFRVISAGPLSYQKDPAVLSEAFSAIAANFPGWDLTFVGDGEQRAALQQLIAEKGLANRISMPGPSHSVSDWYAASHIFCLSSRWEGFPNAIAEAMAHGLPCVGFAGCGGVRDLITNGENGLLAEGNGDAQTLAKSLETMMASVEMRSRLGMRAVQSLNQYAPDEIFSLWEQTLREGTKP